MSPDPHRASPQPHPSGAATGANSEGEAKAEAETEAKAEAKANPVPSREPDLSPAAGPDPELSSPTAASPAHRWRRRLPWMLALAGTLALLGADGWSQEQIAMAYAGGGRSPGVAVGAGHGSVMLAVMIVWPPRGPFLWDAELGPAGPDTERLLGKASWWGHFALGSDPIGLSAKIYLLTVPLVALAALLWLWPAWSWWLGRRRSV